MIAEPRRKARSTSTSMPDAGSEARRAAAAARCGALSSARLDRPRPGYGAARSRPASATPRAPVILAGRASRRSKPWNARVALAETSNANVITDMKIAACITTDISAPQAACPPPPADRSRVGDGRNRRHVANAPHRAAAAPREASLPASRRRGSRTPAPAAWCSRSTSRAAALRVRHRARPAGRPIWCTGRTSAPWSRAV